MYPEFVLLLAVLSLLAVVPLSALIGAWLYYRGTKCVSPFPVNEPKRLPIPADLYRTSPPSPKRIPKPADALVEVLERKRKEDQGDEEIRRLIGEENPDAGL